MSTQMDTPAILTIPVLPFEFAFVDEDDYAWLSGFRWYFANGYARATLPRETGGGRHFMHHLLLPRTDGFLVDHINGNRLDNRRANLRLATPQQNQHNKAKQQASATTSLYKGVSREDGRATWRAQVWHNGRPHFTGRYASELEAARAYDAVALALFGEFARLNFATNGAAQ